ncbi:MAG: hypothetical protein DRJ42_10770 [Deltaproteobacteria bacterium]|nr:MAG: hypothetical protein DRJ42_10770 [Deltaproteobacteria bacterium]
METGASPSRHEERIQNECASPSPPRRPGRHPRPRPRRGWGLLCAARPGPRPPSRRRHHRHGRRWPAPLRRRRRRCASGGRARYGPRGCRLPADRLGPGSDG